jgi:hypothetical protein
MRNRYGDEYSFEKVDENTYTITGNLKHWRCGGKDDENTINYGDLGFVDPSGGPFISKGYLIEGRKVVRIAMVGEKIYFDVQ